MKFFYALILSLILPSLMSAQSNFTQQSVTRFNGKGDFTDRYTCVKTDNNGDIVAAGYTQKNGEKRDVLVAKIAKTSGTILWTYTYNGIGNGDDAAASLAIDASNNIYVTGYVDDNLIGNDVFTVKIAPNGVEQWFKTYNYTAGNQDDAGVSIALDNATNVIVGGYSNSSVDTTLNDYILIKYNNTGTELWNKRFDGAAHGSDKAVKVAVDASNNIFISGVSFNAAGNDDYATLKYDSNGNVLWTMIVDRGKNDRVVDMLVDGTGNVYVTGRSKTTTYDYYTIKYSSAGASVWNHVFNNGNDDRPMAMAINSAGEIIVTGESIQGTQLYNYVTVKISTSGQTIWSNAVYSNAANGDDIPVAVGLDASNNIFVAGLSNINATTKNIITIKYNTAGVQQWLATYDNNAATNKNCEPNALTVGANGDVYVVGYGENASYQRNALVIDYNTSGNKVWASLYDGQGDNSDNIREMVSDATGNLYLAGYTIARATDRNTLLIKTNANGDTLWSRTLNGTSNSTDEWAAVSIDPSGNLIVGGFMKFSGQSYDYFLAKYNPAGDTLWTQHYNGTQNKSDKAYDMKLDGAGNIYLTGRTDNGVTPTTNYDFLTVKYDNNGVFKWAKTYSSAGNLEDKGEKICVSTAGDVYAVGREMISPTNENILTIKYDTNGNQQWTKTKAGSASAQDKPNDAIWYANNVYITGSVTNTTIDAITIKYDAAGTEVWAKTFDSPTGDDDVASALTIDASGNAIFAGYTASPTSGLSDVLVVKYDNAGNQKWFETYNGGNSLSDQGDALTTDAAGNILVAAHIDNGSPTNSNSDFLLMGYSINGALLATQAYNGTGDSTDVPTCILSKSGQVYVVGGSWGGFSQKDIAIVRYSATLLGIEDALPFQNKVAVYPNPCTNNLYFAVKEGNILQGNIEVYDAIGNKIVQTPLSNTQIQSLNMASFASGLYFYQVQSEGKIVAAGKVVRE